MSSCITTVHNLTTAAERSAARSGSKSCTHELISSRSVHSGIGRPTMFLRHLQLIGILVGGICLSFQPVMLAAEPAETNKTFNVDLEASRIFVKVGSATRLGHPH